MHRAEVDASASFLATPTTTSMSTVRLIPKKDGGLSIDVEGTVKQ